MIRREPKDAEHPYTMINNAVIEDPDLSLKAKGLLTYLLSKPDDWKFYVDQLSRCLKEHRNTIARVMQELIDAGYCERTEIRGKDGKFAGYDYDVYEIKNRAQECSTDRALKCSTVTVHKKRDTVNAALLNTDLTNDSLGNLEEISKNSSSDQEPIGREEDSPPCFVSGEEDNADSDENSLAVTIDNALKWALREINSHFDPPVALESFRPIYMKLREQGHGVDYCIHVKENARRVDNARHYVQAIKDSDLAEEWRRKPRHIEDAGIQWFCNACLNLLTDSETCSCGKITTPMMFDEIKAALQQTGGDARVKRWLQKKEQRERDEIRLQTARQLIKKGLINRGDREKAEKLLPSVTGEDLVKLTAHIAEYDEAQTPEGRERRAEAMRKLRNKLGEKAAIR